MSSKKSFLEKSKILVSRGTYKGSKLLSLLKDLR